MSDNNSLISKYIKLPDDSTNKALSSSSYYTPMSVPSNSNSGNNHDGIVVSAPDNSNSSNDNHDKTLVGSPDNSNPSTANHDKTLVTTPDDSNTGVQSNNYESPIHLDVASLTGNKKLVKLEVTSKSGLAKLVPLEVKDIKGDPKLIILDVDKKTGEPKLVKLDVSESSGESKLVKLNVTDILSGGGNKTDGGWVKLVMLDSSTIKSDLSKGREAKLVMLDVDKKTGEPKLVYLKVTAKSGSPKLVTLDVTPIVGEAKLVKLEVNPITKDPVLIHLNVEKEDGVPKLVQLDVIPKFGEPKLVELNVDPISGEAKLVKLEVSTTTGKSLVVPLEVEVKEGRIDLIQLPEGFSSEPDAEKYSSPSGLLSHDPSSGSKRLDINSLTPETRDKYEKTASWLGIPGMEGIKAARDYQDLLEVCDKLGERGDILRSYVTSTIIGAPTHHMKGLPDHAAMRTANLAARKVAGTSIVGAVVDVTKNLGINKDELIHDALIVASDLLLRTTRKSDVALPGTNGFGVISDANKVLTDIAGGKFNLKRTLGMLTAKNDPRNAPIIIKDRTIELPKYDNGVVFSDRFTSKAMMTTVLEVMSTSPKVLGNLNNLRTILTRSANSSLTNYKNHLAPKEGKFKGIGNLGLDSNHVWEMTLEPLIDNKLNGGFTYLPNIRYMNYLNSDQFGITTGYGRWLPFNSFELQDRKLTSRSVNLFDGDIAVPISMEFTNELRVTLVDDQLKTFRRYFDMASKAAVFKSKSYSSNEDLTDPEIDESQQLVAMYKNVTFVCNIYIMNGEFATVKKYPLLVVLRDHQVEYSGETESGGNDLSLQFSIVGDLTKPDENAISTRTSEKSAYIDASKVNNSNYQSESPPAPSAGVTVGTEEPTEFPILKDGRALNTTDLSKFR